MTELSSDNRQLMYQCVLTVFTTFSRFFLSHLIENRSRSDALEHLESSIVCKLQLGKHILKIEFHVFFHILMCFVLLVYYYSEGFKACLEYFGANIG